MAFSICLSVRWGNKWNWYSSGLNTSILVWRTCASALSGWVLYRQLELTKLTSPDLHHVVGLFILRDIRQSLEYPCALRVLNISPWFSRFISDSITWDMLLENDGNFGEVINGTDIRPDSTHLYLYDILVQAPSRAGFCTPTCASALSGWVLYRQLELTKLTSPDLHHVVGLFILRDVRMSVYHTFFTMFLS